MSIFDISTLVSAHCLCVCVWLIGMSLAQRHRKQSRDFRFKHSFDNTHTVFFSFCVYIRAELALQQHQMLDDYSAVALTFESRAPLCIRSSSISSLCQLTRCDVCVRRVRKVDHRGPDSTASLTL